jgi:cytochrome c-type biogenesis protein CcmE
MTSGDQKPVNDHPDDDLLLPVAPAKPATLFNPRVKLGIVFALVAVGLIYFGWTAFSSSTVNFHKVAEVTAAGPTPDTTTVGVIGKLVPDSYARSADGVTANFALVDDGGSQQMQVMYRGEIGQVFFNDHSEIILQGRLGTDEVFHADTLTVRCPSKYLNEQEKAELEAQQNGGTPVPPPY